MKDVLLGFTFRPPSIYFFRLLSSLPPREHRLRWRTFINNAMQAYWFGLVISIAEAFATATVKVS